MDLSEEKNVTNENDIEKASDSKRPETEDKIETDQTNVNLTISTKLSTDQLVCKSPPDSSSVSVRSSIKNEKKKKNAKKIETDILCLGILQILLGLFMIAFGIMTIFHQASLSMIGAGIWSGLLCSTAGIFSIFASTKKCCTAISSFEKLSHTICLALSLVGLALAQLVVVLSAISLSKDLNNQENENYLTEEGTPSFGGFTADGKFAIIIPENYMGILSNFALIVASSLQCVCCIVVSVKKAKDVFPCIQKKNVLYTGFEDNRPNNRHALVQSWLGKHSPPPQLYIVSSDSTLGKGSKVSNRLSLTPVFALPPHQMMQQPPVVNYPLIPAPLGIIPSPVIPPSPPKQMYKRYRRALKTRSLEHTPRRRSRSGSIRSKSDRAKERRRSQASISEKEVVQSYTGLDKTIAENFISICESRQKSCTLPKKSESNKSSSSSSGCDTDFGTDNSTSDFTNNSKEHLVKK